MIQKSMQFRVKSMLTKTVRATGVEDSKRFLS